MLTAPTLILDRSANVVRPRFGPITIHGYASRFNAVAIARNNGNRRISISPGAFVLPGEVPGYLYDVELLVGHNRDLLLGSTEDGSLTLAQDETGLRFECRNIDGRLEHVEAEIRTAHYRLPGGELLTANIAAQIAAGGWGSCVHLHSNTAFVTQDEAGETLETVTRTIISEITIGPGSGYCPGTSCEIMAVGAQCR